MWSSYKCLFYPFLALNIFIFLVYLLYSISCELLHSEEQNTHFLDHSSSLTLSRRDVSSITPDWSSSNHTFPDSQGLHSCPCAFPDSQELHFFLCHCYLFCWFFSFSLKHTVISFLKIESLSWSSYISPVKATLFTLLPHFSTTPVHSPFIHEQLKFAYQPPFPVKIFVSHQWALSCQSWEKFSVSTLVYFFDSIVFNIVFPFLPFLAFTPYLPVSSYYPSWLSF